MKITYFRISTEVEDTSGEVKQSATIGLISEDKQKHEGATTSDSLESNTPIRKCPMLGDQHQPGV